MPRGLASVFKCVKVRKAIKEKAACNSPPAKRKLRDAFAQTNWGQSKMNIDKVETDAKYNAALKKRCMFLALLNTLGAQKLQPS